MEQQATVSAFRLSLFHQRWLVIVSSCPSGMTKQQLQSLHAFLLKDCHHVSVQWDSVPAETLSAATRSNSLCHSSVTWAATFFHCEQLLRQSTKMHSHWACAAQLPFNNSPARQLGFNFYLATASHPEKPPLLFSESRINALSILFNFGKVNVAAAKEYLHKSWNRAQSCCIFCP